MADYESEVKRINAFTSYDWLSDLVPAAFLLMGIVLIACSLFLTMDARSGSVGRIILFIVGGMLATFAYVTIKARIARRTAAYIAMFMTFTASQGRQGIETPTSSGQ